MLSFKNSQRSAVGTPQLLFFRTRSVLATLSVRRQSASITSALKTIKVRLQGPEDRQTCCAKGSDLPLEDRIFVSVAAYRDPDTRTTVHHLFQQVRARAVPSPAHVSAGWGCAVPSPAHVSAGSGFRPTSVSLGEAGGNVRG